MSAAELDSFLSAHPGITGCDLLLPDLNGIFRGVRVRPEELAGIFRNGACMAASTQLLDTRGTLLDGMETGESDGDPDHLCLPVAGTLAPVTWAAEPRAQLMVAMQARDGREYHADSRQLLQRMLRALGARGLRPVVAFELEFQLLADAGVFPPSPWSPATRSDGAAPPNGRLHCLEVFESLEPFIADVYAACAAQGIPAGTLMSESAPGQFELNLHHVADAERACDHAILLRRLVRGVARTHGLGATFMAKPFTDRDGNGMHLHLSLLDTHGNNVFAGNPPPDAPEAWSPALRHATAGLLATLAEAMAIFAPNGNSYRRLRPGHFAPTAATWGNNHRAATVRLPVADDPNVRIEHRAAGADANPYLVLAAILAGIEHGLTKRIEPPPMLAEGQHVTGEDDRVPCWEQALAAFERSTILREAFGDAFCDTYSRLRWRELDAFRAEVSAKDHAWYMGAF